MHWRPVQGLLAEDTMPLT